MEEECDKRKQQTSHDLHTHTHTHTHTHKHTLIYIYIYTRIYSIYIHIPIMVDTLLLRASLPSTTLADISLPLIPSSHNYTSLPSHLV